MHDGVTSPGASTVQRLADSRLRSTPTPLATLAARVRATMLGAILEEPPFVDDTSALGARAGGGANVLQRHEEILPAIL